MARRGFDDGFCGRPMRATRQVREWVVRPTKGLPRMPPWRKVVRNFEDSSYLQEYFRGQRRRFERDDPHGRSYEPIHLYIEL